MKTINRESWIRMAFLVALVCCGLCLMRASASWAAPAASGRAEPPPDMRLIVGGVYIPLFKTEGVEPATPVSPFYLDVYPVTNAQYMAFVQNNLRWRRSQVSPLLADLAYLQHWQTDFPHPEGAAAMAQRPET